MPRSSSWREILNPEKPLTKLTEGTKGARSRAFVSIVSPFVANRNQEFSRPSESTHKTDKTLTQEEAEAVRLLNLAGVRIIRSGQGFEIGVWEDLDGTELRAALRVAGLDVHPVTHLESPDIPARYKIRHAPDRNPGESFERWRVRALAEARRRWGWQT